jgi:hypothetical protein
MLYVATSLLKQYISPGDYYILLATVFTFFTTSSWYQLLALKRAGLYDHENGQSLGVGYVALGYVLLSACIIFVQFSRDLWFSQYC